tara:strand:- start:390 stop:578 length:189 start_codon:yes stop_codon:yes gene_type:complete
MGKIRGEKYESWLREHIICDEWGRGPSLADVPMTIMTREQAFKKQNKTDADMKKEYQKGVKK